MELQIRNYNSLSRDLREREGIRSIFSDLFGMLIDLKITDFELIPITENQGDNLWVVFELINGSEIGIAFKEDSDLLNPLNWNSLVQIGSKMQGGEINSITRIRHFHRNNQIADKCYRVVLYTSIGRILTAFITIPSGETELPDLSDLNPLAKVKSSGMEIAMRAEFLLGEIALNSEMTYPLSAHLLRLSNSSIEESINLRWIKDQEFLVVEECNMDKETQVSAKIVLGKISLKLEELINLAPGTKLELNCPQNIPVHLEVGDDKWADGTINWQGDFLELTIKKQETLQ